MKIVWVIVGVVIAGFLYWTISPFFIVKEVHDTLPIVENVESKSAPVPIVDTPLHPADGTVRIVEANGKQYIRYENYKTINGPDLFVYLAKDTSAKEFISLGKIRGTMGEVQYEVPHGTPIAEYPYVLTWCRAFGVLFNYADMRPFFEKSADSGTLCAEVITSARNADTGEIREFPTPCDVPQGWDVIENDIPTL